MQNLLIFNKLLIAEEGTSTGCPSLWQKGNFYYKNGIYLFDGDVTRGARMGAAHRFIVFFCKYSYPIVSVCNDFQ